MEKKKTPLCFLLPKLWISPLPVSCQKGNQPMVHWALPLHYCYVCGWVLQKVENWKGRRAVSWYLTSNACEEPIEAFLQVGLSQRLIKDHGPNSLPLCFGPSSVTWAALPFQVPVRIKWYVAQKALSMKPDKTHSINCSFQPIRLLPSQAVPSESWKKDNIEDFKTKETLKTFYVKLFLSQEQN